MYRRFCSKPEQIFPFIFYGVSCTFLYYFETTFEKSQLKKQLYMRYLMFKTIILNNFTANGKRRKTPSKSSELGW